MQATDLCNASVFHLKIKTKNQIIAEYDSIAIYIKYKPGLRCRAHKYSKVIWFLIVLELTGISTKSTVLPECHQAFNLQTHSLLCDVWIGVDHFGFSDFWHFSLYECTVLLVFVNSSSDFSLPSASGQRVTGQCFQKSFCHYEVWNNPLLCMLGSFRVKQHYNQRSWSSLLLQWQGLGGLNICHLTHPNNFDVEQGELCTEQKHRARHK